MTLCEGLARYRLEQQGTAVSISNPSYEAVKLRGDSIEFKFLYGLYGFSFLISFSTTCDLKSRWKFEDEDDVKIIETMCFYH